MKPAPFAYARPASLDDALRMLSADAGDAMPIAGGQSLVPLLALRMSAAERLVDIGRLDALRHVAETASTVTIGAGITHAEIEDGRVPDPANGLMRRIASGIAYRAIRNQGTIGGSVALADPAADWPSCLIALRAVAKIAGPNGERHLAVTDLIEGIFATGLAPAELIVGFDIPKLAPTVRVGFAKVARKTGAFAMSLAIVVLDGADTRVVLGGASTRPLTLAHTSAALVTADAREAALRDAIARDFDTIDDLDAYAHRLHTATILRATAEARAS
ncbi:MAG TPA: FAD binding domain-containing protein [Pseudolabrys sp.]|uniref:FAD binding domain-containing protein n=1 Tax=Pseudolabrys sp. TaxID=1960880 RepID=UPI002DDCB004|nr:FAD binding domain-containing protein [Pseudolabrys sp.]HEV2628308.1 FAD binding domain-containing protein [Pseudolabrys sp.]